MTPNAMHEPIAGDGVCISISTRPGLQQERRAAFVSGD
jgi:hypothetical protein